MHTRFDTESKIAVTQAADIARELGHREVGPGHLLAGLLANPRGTAYAALRDHGLDLDTARDLVAEHHVDVQDDHDDHGDHGDPEDTDGVDRYEEDREALQAIGIDLDRVREAVRTNLGADLADGWAARPDRGSRREGGRGRGGHHHGRGHGRGQGRGQGRGRRGPRSRRDDLRFSRELRAVLRDATREERVPGMTGARMLVALTRSDDPAVQAVLARSTGIEGLRAQAEAALRPASQV